MNARTMPVESQGQCIAMKTGRRKKFRCRYKGYLADGLCMSCWDRRQGTSSIAHLV